MFNPSSSTAQAIFLPIPRDYSPLANSLVQIFVAVFNQYQPPVIFPVKFDSETCFFFFFLRKFTKRQTPPRAKFGPMTPITMTVRTAAFRIWTSAAFWFIETRFTRTRFFIQTLAPSSLLKPAASSSTLKMKGRSLVPASVVTCASSRRIQSCDRTSSLVFRKRWRSCLALKPLLDVSGNDLQLSVKRNKDQKFGV